MGDPRTSGVIGDLRTSGMIVLRDAAPGHPGAPPVLSGVNLRALPGEMVALVGRNGSGKSTLLRSLAGILPLKEGVCELGGSPLSAYDPGKRARMISMVTSGVPILPSMSISELVFLGRIPYTGWLGRYGQNDRQKVTEALQKLGLQSLAGRMVDQVSDGERQRAMIARAFVQDTPVMLLDEPTAFLDLPARFGLTRVLEEFRESGKTVVYATHDLEMALMHADRLWVIDRGKVVEGGPEDLGLSGLFDRLFIEEGIAFDHIGGRFTERIHWKGTFTISGGDDAVRNWTGKALNRVGFRAGEGTGVGEPGKGQLTAMVRIEGERRSYLWRLQAGGKEISFDRIHALVQYLTREK